MPGDKELVLRLGWDRESFKKGLRDTERDAQRGTARINRRLGRFLSPTASAAGLASAGALGAGVTAVAIKSAIRAGLQDASEARDRGFREGRPVGQLGIQGVDEALVRQQQLIAEQLMEFNQAVKDMRRDVTNPIAQLIGSLGTDFAAASRGESRNLTQSAFGAAKAYYRNLTGIGLAQRAGQAIGSALIPSPNAEQRAELERRQEMINRKLRFPFFPGTRESLTLELR